MRFLLFTIVLCSFLNTSYADERDKWPEGSAMHTGHVFNDNVEYFRTLLKREEKMLIESLEKSKADLGIQHAIKKALAIWHDYSAAECNAFGQLTQAGGSWRHTWSNKCRWRLYEHRYKRVRDAANCIKRNYNDSTQYFHATNCLPQILPLNFKGQ